MKKFLLAFLLLVCSANTVFAHDLTDSEERQFGIIVNAMYEQKTPSKSSAVLDSVLHDIIQANKNRFNPRGTRHLAESIRLDYKNLLVNSYSLPGGIIHVTQGAYNLASTVNDGGYYNPNRSNSMKKSNIYNNSMLAFIITHEIGHWYNEDFMDEVDSAKAKPFIEAILKSPKLLETKEARYLSNYYFASNSKASAYIENEQKADIVSWKYGNTGAYSSTGGSYMFLHRLEKLQALNGITESETEAKNPHPTKASRIAMLDEFISKQSDGSVSFDDKGSFFYKGTQIAPPATGEVTGNDRAYYIGSQISLASSKGLNISLGKCFGDTCIMSDNIVIDKFCIPMERAKKILDGSVSPANNEERYLLKLYRLLA